jgi:hypothetical protein
VRELSVNCEIQIPNTDVVFKESSQLIFSIISKYVMPFAEPELHQVGGAEVLTKCGSDFGSKLCTQHFIKITLKFTLTTISIIKI